MTYRTRKIISNILLFIESILLFSIVILFTLKITILNKNNIIKKIDKTNYYEKVYNETIDNMKYITRKSGYSSKIIDDVLSIEDIKRDVNEYVENIYSNNKIEVNTQFVKANIEENLNNYIKENNLKIEESEKKEYINKITSTYKNEIRLMKQFNDVSKDINKYNSLSNILLLLFIIDLVILVIINKKIFNKQQYHILCFQTALSSLITCLYIKIMYKKLFIYNNAVTDVFKLVIKKGLGINIIFIIILTIIGIITYKKIKEEKEVY